MTPMRVLRFPEDGESIEPGLEESGPAILVVLNALPPLREAGKGGAGTRASRHLSLVMNIDISVEAHL